MSAAKPEPICTDIRPCFARFDGRCKLLIDAYGADAKSKASWFTQASLTQENVDRNNRKPCPFCKPEKEITDGKFYPYTHPAQRKPKECNISS